MSMPFTMIPLPPERSTIKPRRRGLTMMMDWGLPLGAQADWLDLIAPHVDLAKLVVGTARLYEEDYLRRKLALYEEHRGARGLRQRGEAQRCRAPRDNPHGGGLRAARARRGGLEERRLIGGLRRGLDVDRVIFELSGPWIPGTSLSEIYELKVFLVKTFGPDVNLANIMPETVWETEALRAGLSVPGPLHL